MLVTLHKGIITKGAKNPKPPQPNVRKCASHLKILKNHSPLLLHLTKLLIRLMSSLSQRLQKLQVKVAKPLPNVSRYSTLELDQLKIEFGTKHLGHSFQKVWNDDHQWISWFVKHYQNSTKGVHRLLMQYRAESQTCRTGRGRDHGAGVSPTAPPEDAYRGEWDNQKLMAKATRPAQKCLWHQRV
jgi:hypothetical protein